MNRKFWIGVASKEHVFKGVEGGFCQLCHGKATPLKRMSKGDYIIYYSSKEKITDKEPYQKFTALGKVVSDEVYQYAMSADFTPYRKDIAFLNAREIEIRPLIDYLDFIPDKKRWGYPFRYGYLEIEEADFKRIASQMLDRDNFEDLSIALE